MTLGRPGVLLAERISTGSSVVPPRMTARRSGLARLLPTSDPDPYARRDATAPAGKRRYLCRCSPALQGRRQLHVHNLHLRYGCRARVENQVVRGPGPPRRTTLRVPDRDHDHVNGEGVWAGLTTAQVAAGGANTNAGPEAAAYPLRSGYLALRWTRTRTLREPPRASPPQRA